MYKKYLFLMLIFGLYKFDESNNGPKIPQFNNKENEIPSKEEFDEELNEDYLKPLIGDPKIL